ncbi:MAG: BrnT family toxin [Rickettsiales bacterium]|jgi:uncharacterized DUF497 family protein|nr:BrnT family toxin [Rickettsiales bacterium]
MEYEWDNKKNESNIAKHGFPLSLAVYVFRDKNRTEVEDDRKDYGEPRYLTYGMIRGRLFCVCYTLRDEARRIISVFPISKKKKDLYYGDSKDD